MSVIFDHMCDSATMKAELAVEFSVPVSGWVSLWIHPLLHTSCIYCSEVWDPFEDFIEWLEQIASGALTATWCINQEGLCGRLQFYGATVDDCNDYLLHIRSNRDGLNHVTGISVERRQLIESFYRAFRIMTLDPDYEAREWEPHPLFPLTEKCDEEEYDEAWAAYPFCGVRLRELTSPVIETYLSDEPDRQMALDLGLPLHRFR